MGSLISKIGSLASLWSWVSVLRDAERMHAHSVSNVYAMVFNFFAKCSSLFCLSM